MSKLTRASVLILLAGCCLLGALQLGKATFTPPPTAWAFISEQAPSGTNTVTFSSIPGSYRHLVIEYLARGDQALTSSAVNLTFNGDTSANYDSVRANVTHTNALATGEQLAATSATIAVVTAASAPSNYAAGGTILIPYYASTAFYKVVTNGPAGSLLAQTTGNVNARFGEAHWRSLSAITSATLTLGGGNYVAGSKFSLYGVY